MKLTKPSKFRQIYLKLLPKGKNTFLGRQKILQHSGEHATIITKTYIKISDPTYFFLRGKQVQAVKKKISFTIFLELLLARNYLNQCSESSTPQMLEVLKYL